jgi:tetratricopeptide (TPR) repeat protein
LGELHQASLVQTQDFAGEPRFSLLETTREFAQDQLEAEGLAEGARAAHAGYYCAMVERSQPELTGPDQVAWLRQLDRELPNLRAALEWSQVHALEINIRLSVALGTFWIVRGHLSEGRRWLRAAIQSIDRLSPDWRARGLMMVGRLAWRQGDYREAQQTLTQSRELFEQIGDVAGLAFTLFNLGAAVERQGDYATGRAYLEDSLRFARTAGDTYTEACALSALGEIANRQGDINRDREYTQQALALHQARRDPRMTAAMLMNLGISSVDAGDIDEGQRQIQASLDVARELDQPHLTVDCLVCLGDVRLIQGRPAEARGYLEEAIAICHATHAAAYADFALATLGQALEQLGDFAGARARQVEALRLRVEAGDQYYLATSLTHLARILWREQAAERAVRLLSAADAIRDAIGALLRPVMRTEYDELVAGLRASLGEEAYRQAWEAGQALSQEDAVELALASA